VFEVSTASAVHWADEFRLILAGRRKRRRQLRVAALAGFAAIPLLLSALWTPSVLLVWNASPSAPVGLYRLHADRTLSTGNMVVARTPEPARTLAARRHYLPANVPLVKRVAARAGDRVCASGAAISINGWRAASRRNRDGAGRAMPWWTGCRRLEASEYFLLMDSPQSFDGRYFGVTRANEILGRAELLWAR
jgi:conjugative transfer signal peptidase TraF